MKLLKTAVILGTALLLLSGCKPSTTTPSGPVSDRAKKLDFIFSTKSVGKITITMERSEWNQMLKNFDYFYKNENCVKFTRFEYEKDGEKWDLDKGGGIRLRGNTSRFRPQGKDYPMDSNGNKKMNADWNSAYYEYAANCSDDDYRQSHFKVDFEEFLEDGDEQKLAGCMKGVALKRMDSSCTKEIFCYDLFHRYGIWTAPRASHTRVFFNFIEEDGSVTPVDYGVYEMFEEVNKQSLKARDKDSNSAVNAWKNSKGNLWKCGGGDLTNPNATMYAERIEITDFDENGNPTNYVWDSPTYDLKTNKDKVDEAAAEFRSFIAQLNALPNVANANDKTSINAIKAFYEKWMDVDFFLKTYAISILVGMDDDYWANANNYYLYFADTGKGRKVYLIPFDYDNTLGSSIMGDGSKGEKEGIEQNPFEWGRGHNRPLMDKLIQVPEYKDRFKNLLLQVSASDSEWNYEKCSNRWYEYWAMVDPYLYSADLSDHICTKGHWDNVYKPSGYSLVNESNNLYDYTRECFLGYLASVKVDLNGGKFEDKTGVISIPYYSMKESPTRDGYMFLGWTKTKGGDDYVTSYEFDKTYYASWYDTSSLKPYDIFEVKNSSVDGICIGIYGMPEDTKIRTFYLNTDLENNPWAWGSVVSEIDNYQTSNVNKNLWVYPYITPGKQYKFTLVWKDKDWSTIQETPPSLTVTAASGLGDNWVDFGSGYNPSVKEAYTITHNWLKWNYNPKIYICGKEIYSDGGNMPGDIRIELRDKGYEWYGEIVTTEYPLPEGDFLDIWREYLSRNTWNTNTPESLKNNENLYLNMKYVIGNSVYGNYYLCMLTDNNRENRYFAFELD